MPQPLTSALYCLLAFARRPQQFIERRFFPQVLQQRRAIANRPGRLAGSQESSNSDAVLATLVGCTSDRNYCSFAYSALASFRMGMSGSASFQRVRKSL